MSTINFFIFFIWLLGGFAGGVTGVGTAMITVPILIMFFPITSVVPASCFIIGGVGLHVWLLFRKHCDYSQVLLLLLGSLPGIYLGILMLKDVSTQILHGLIGVSLLFYVSWQFVHKTSIHIQNKRIYTLITGACAGFTNTSISFIGPPVSVFGILVGWNKDVMRGTTGLFFFVSALLGSFFQFQAGLFDTASYTIVLWGLPGLIVGLLLSIPAAKKIPEKLFQKALLIIIFLAGVQSLFKAF